MLIAQCERLSERFGVVIPRYGHAGDGNIHVKLLSYDPTSRSKCIRRSRRCFARWSR